MITGKNVWRINLVIISAGGGIWRRTVLSLAVPHTSPLLRM